VKNNVLDICLKEVTSEIQYFVVFARNFVVFHVLFSLRIDSLCLM